MFCWSSTTKLGMQGSCWGVASEIWTLDLMLLNINLFNWGGGCLAGGRLTWGTALDKEVIIFIPWLCYVECRWGLSGCNYLRSVQRVTPILQQQAQSRLSLDLLLWLSLGFQAASTLLHFSAWPAYFIRITPNCCVKWCLEVFLLPLVCYYLLRYDAT